MTSDVGRDSTQTGVSFSNLNEVADKADKSATKADKELKSWLGRVIHLVTGESDKIPKWASDHISKHNELAKTVKSLQCKGEPIPKEVLAKFEYSKSVLHRIAGRVNQEEFLKAILPDPSKRIDTYGFLSGKGGQIPTTLEEWHLNLGLLMDVYNKTDNPQLKNQINFLALHYLAKAAPINIAELELPENDKKVIQNMFQFGFFEDPMTYHREAKVFEKFVVEKLDTVFVENSGNFYLTDTKDFAALLPLMYTVGSNAKTPEESVPKWSESIVSKFTEQLSNNPKLDLSKYMQPPLLFDFTEFVEKDIKRTNDPGKDGAFGRKVENLEAKLDEAVIAAAKEIKAKNPNLAIDQKTLEAFIRANTTCICRTEEKGIGVLKSLNVFMKPQFFEGATERILKTSGSANSILSKRVSSSNGWMEAFLNATGIRLGGVRGRANVFELMDLPQFLEKTDHSRKIVEYSVKGANALYFPNKSDFTESNLMKTLGAKFANYDSLLKTQPQAAILGKSTLDLVKGLLSEIPQAKWDQLNNDPNTREIVQTCLVRLMNHLGTANLHMDNFTKFSQAIELAHCEIATLLSITQPFKETDFATIYKENLTHIPPELSGMVQVGIGKSAMNVFSGINAALLQNNQGGKVERTYGDGSYFEEVQFIGENRSTQDILANANLKKIDLYVGEFNHNINIDPNHTTYKGSNIIGDVEKLLKAKPDTEHLTVAVDETIDFVNSNKTQQLLERFKDEIKSGKLNFVFFRSGQKFDMLGMDNYYGSPFYMINNGGQQWKNFNALTTSQTHQTDPLSGQWFSLANKYAFKPMEDYRATVFNNAKAILSQIPENLKPGKNSKIRISTVEKGANGESTMDAAFIDIKIITNKGSGAIRDNIQKKLYHKFAEYEKKIHSRGSFGFYHPNFNVIEGDNFNVRINPGLDPSEVKIIVEFLNEIAKDYADANTP